MRRSSPARVAGVSPGEPARGVNTADGTCANMVQRERSTFKELKSFPDGMGRDISLSGDLGSHL